MIDRVIRDSYQWFVDIVVERRDMPEFKVLQLADGSIFTGNQSLENGLIDAVGGEKVAVAWLKKEKGIDEKLKVVERKPKRPTDSIFDNPAAIAKFARIFGIEIGNSDAKALEDTLREHLPLDGLVSIWQGSGN
jgi:protease-4